jgi:hypothetical protein
MNGSGTYTGSASQNTWMLTQMKNHGYKSGTSNASKGLHWTQEDGEEIILRRSDGAVLTPLGSGDMVFDNESSQRLWELANNPEAIASLIQNPTAYTLPDIEKINNCSVNNQSTNIGDISIKIELPNVTNYPELKNQLIKDSSFSKAVQAETNYAITGKGTPLDKLKYSR